MKHIIIALSIIFLASGCSSTSKPVMTPMEKQSMQTREYDSTKSIVFSSVISVFQDLGYTIDAADVNTGLIKSLSATENSAFLTFMTGATRNTQTAANAFVEQIGGVVKVRLTFVTRTKSSSAYGASDQSDVPIYDAAAYQAAFDKIENAIFVRS